MNLFPIKFWRLNILALFLAITLSGCYSYNISTPTPAFLTEPQEMKVEGMIAATGPEAKVSYAPVNHVIVQGSYKLFYNNEIAGGFFSYTDSSQTHIELLGGYGQGSAHKRDFLDISGSSTDFHNYHGTYNKYFMHFAAGQKLKQGVFGFTLRFTKVDYTITSVWGDFSFLEGEDYDFIYAELFLSYQHDLGRGFSFLASGGVNLGDDNISHTITGYNGDTWTISEELSPVNVMLLRIGLAYRFNFNK